MKTSENTIVAFHIGRGGRFNNAGHLFFIGEKKIGEFTGELFSEFENLSEFENRFGFDGTGDPDQKCILDLVTERDFDELEEKFGITEEMLGDEVYHNGGGNPTGLTKSNVESGIGRINIDNEYDTTYTKFLVDCTEEEIELIKNSENFNTDELISMLEENQ